MSFLAPAYLWGLALLAPLAAIYFLKVRPRRKQTNAFFLWATILEEKSASALFRRFRDVLSLLLMALVLLLAVFAMARPKLADEDPRDLLIVVDVSASMGASDGGQTAFDSAIAEAKTAVRALDGTRRALVAGLSDSLFFASHLSDSPKDLLDAIDVLEVTPLPVSQAAIADLNRFAERENTRVLFVTDDQRGLETVAEGVERLVIGTPQGNVGFVAADLAWVPGKDATVSFFFKVASSFEEEKEVELLLKDASTDALARVLPLVIEPGANVAQTIQVEGVQPGGWVAELDFNDALLADNRVDLALNERTRIGVSVLASAPYFFERSVEAFQRAGSGFLELRESGADVVVSDSGVADGERLILFAPEGESEWWEDVGDAAEVLAPEEVAKGHPLLRHLDIESLPFAGAKALKAPEGSVVLAASENGVPLIYKLQRPGRTAVVFNLDPAQGDFFLSPWFPVMVYDAARDLVGRKDSLRSVYATGTKAPGTPGLYDSDDGSYGIALLESDETLIDREVVSSEKPQVARGQLLGWWLLVIALVLLAVESMLYHRRKLG